MKPHVVFHPLVAAEATRDLPTAEGEIETPLETAAAQRMVRRVVAVPVLRAGLGMDLQDAIVYLLDPMLATGGSAAMAIEGRGSWAPGT